MTGALRGALPSLDFTDEALRHREAASDPGLPCARHRLAVGTQPWAWPWEKGRWVPFRPIQWSGACARHQPGCRKRLQMELASSPLPRAMEPF